MQEIDVSCINRQIPFSIINENLEIGKFLFLTKYEENYINNIPLICDLTLQDLNIKTNVSLPEVLILNIYSMSEDEEFKTYKADNTFVRNKFGSYEMKQSLSYDTPIPYECHLYLEITNKVKEIIDLGKDYCIQINLNISISESKN